MNEEIWAQIEDIHNRVSRVQWYLLKNYWIPDSLTFYANCIWHYGI